MEKGQVKTRENVEITKINYGKMAKSLCARVCVCVCYAILNFKRVCGADWVRVGGKGSTAGPGKRPSSSYT